MNKVILSGRIASELELKKTPSDASVCSFRLAVNRRFKNAEGNYDADFISCVAWRSNADFICKYFSKGDPIEIVGSIQTRNYEKDGQTIYITEVLIDETGFVLSNKKDGNKDSQSDAQPDAFAQMDNMGFVPMPTADNDLPF